MLEHLLEYSPVSTGEFNAKRLEYWDRDPNDNEAAVVQRFLSLTR